MGIQNASALGRKFARTNIRDSDMMKTGGETLRLEKLGCLKINLGSEEQRFFSCILRASRLQRQLSCGFGQKARIARARFRKGIFISFL